MGGKWPRDPGRDGDRGVDLVERTRGYALRIIRLYANLPRTTVAQVMGKQALRSGTSVGAHVRESRRSRFDAEFISKLEGAPSRNWRKRHTGWSCCKSPSSCLRLRSRNTRAKPTN